MPDQPKDSGQQVPAPTGGEVERYAPRFVRSFDARSAVVEMMHDPIGEWVRYEDYEKLRHEFDLLVDYYSTPTPEEMDVMNPEMDQS